LARFPLAAAGRSITCFSTVSGVCRSHSIFIAGSARNVARHHRYLGSRRRNDPLGSSEKRSFARSAPARSATLARLFSFPGVRQSSIHVGGNSKSIGWLPSLGSSGAVNSRGRFFCPARYIGSRRGHTLPSPCRSDEERGISFAGAGEAFVRNSLSMRSFWAQDFGKLPRRRGAQVHLQRHPAPYRSPGLREIFHRAARIWGTPRCYDRRSPRAPNRAGKRSVDLGSGRRYTTKLRRCCNHENGKIQ